MKILENINSKINSEKINSKKINRKKFIFYSGITLAGVYAMFKLPMNFFRNKKEADKISEGKPDGIQININPNAVKRTLRGNNG